MRVDLTSCDREPIHVPGAIQPHGALLALDAQLHVRHASANMEEFLGVSAADALGRPLTEEAVGEGVLEELRRAFHSDRPIDLLNPLSIRGGELEGVAHRNGGLLVLELERPAPGSSPHLYAVASQRALARLQGCRAVPDLLEAAVEEIKALSGFDRVMAYRFAQDGHGEVVAESCAASMEPYLGLHYPASDIPAQARRLYTLNPIRLIVDVAYEPVEIHPKRVAETGELLDLSHAWLRSVSPIHCEYLSNMGVHASMSISLMVEGKLWGLIACHHQAPLHLAFSTRITALLLGRTLSMMIEQLDRQHTEARYRRGHDALLVLVRQCETAEDVCRGLAQSEETLLRLFDAEGAAMTVDSRIVRLGAAPPEGFIAELVEWLSSQGASEGPTVTRSLAAQAPSAAAHAATACGLLADAYHLARDGYLMLFRPEHREQVHWAGDPNKPAVAGPHGVRLTPRGSFELWKQESSGLSRAWDPVEVELLESLCQRLTELSLSWSSARDRMRETVIGMVGHDLRTPLSAISMAAKLLEEEDRPGPLAKRISSSSLRMKTLVDQLLDLSQIQSGKGLGLQRTDTDLHALIERILQEIEMAFPGCSLALELRGSPIVRCDPARLEQVVSNLVSNARHHGERGRGITVRAADDGPNHLVLSVHNWGEPIPPQALPTLFQAYQGAESRPHRASGGLGLGLYITHAVVQEHGGSLEVSSDREQGTRFSVRLPRFPPSKS